MKNTSQRRPKRRNTAVSLLGARIRTSIETQSSSLIDAPMLAFFYHHDKWIVSGQDCAGGMGPADFIDEWETPEECVKDILDFFFGDPTRMQKKAAEHEKAEARYREYIEARNEDSSAKPT